MSLSRLPLSYCTNVHPGITVREVEAGLDRYTVAARSKSGKDLAAGLWLAQPVLEELLASPNALSGFAERLSARGLTTHTLNAFPYGNFHGARVKEQVYLPDWSQPPRLEYTRKCASILAELLPAGTEGSISTLPLGFKHLPHRPDFMEACIEQLIACARHLDRLRGESGKTIRLAIEPEPLCLLETTDEAIEFFHQLRERAAAAGAVETVERYIGLCYDVCHQAVEFEDVAASILSLDRAGVRINKVHISCALELEDPGGNVAGREALRHYIEPRYLHQTLARTRDGRIAREIDLNQRFLDAPATEFASADAWRVHFHVPVNAESLGPLRTTRAALREALTAVAGLQYAPHLEVETYTWNVLPGAGQVDLAQGLAEELIATRDLLESIGDQA
ncbi:MAG TPA: metabolite traffic protein EboE [Tepidisphaeraceae bacterium]|nr:metabolite traffic protein EboE [Tepidisphaeraceae bacterium]